MNSQTSSDKKAKIFEIGTDLIRTLSTFYDEFKVFAKKKSIIDV